MLTLYKHQNPTVIRPWGFGVSDTNYKALSLISFGLRGYFLGVAFVF